MARTLLLRGLLLLAFMGLVPAACCDAPTFDFLSLQRITFDLVEAGPPITGYVVNNRTVTSKLRLDVRLQVDLVSIAPPALPSFTGLAMATSPCNPEYGGQGLKDKAATVTLTSRGLFNGVAAGQPLNQFVRCVGTPNSRDTVAVPLPQLADAINRWATKNLTAHFSLYLSPKPRDNARQQFELRIKMDSGRELVQTTPEIQWE